MGEPVDQKLIQDAFLYVQPLVETRRQHRMHNARFGPDNALTAFRRLLDDTVRTVPSPNSDTLYTAFGYDLADGPLVIVFPEVEPDRYYVLPFYDAFTNVYASYGTRTGKFEPGPHLLVGPGYDGEIPDAMPVIESPTQRGAMLGRFLVYGPEDLPTIHAIQDTMSVTTLADWKAGKRGITYTEAGDQPWPERGSAVPDVKTEPVEFWKAVDEMMPGTPISERDRAYFDRFAVLGLTRDGFTEPADPAVRDALYQGTLDGWKFLTDMGADQSKAEALGVHFLHQNGWDWSAVGGDPDNTGVRDYGTDYTLRAWVNLLYYGELPPEEALYPTSFYDEQGVRMDGSAHSYTLTIDTTNLPNHPNGFWSVTMYDLDGYLVPNALDRFKLSSHSELTPDPDGNITLTISHDQPADEKANWLPAPATQFYLMFRAYLPVAAVVEGTYPFPIVQRS
ncbi:DUF1254 domain-containing protein [Nocardia neocaledoniensis]|uniref:DUF1254 domain-containing protein n=1 Tax=Nocardia neocaledoniensis TaxID=236511 RepID=UPI00340C2A34